MKKFIFSILITIMAVPVHAQFMFPASVVTAESGYGPELITTNGDFATSGDWGPSNGAVISGGVCSISTTANYSSFLSRSVDVGIEYNHTYEISFDLTVTSGSIRFGLGNTSNGVYTDTFTTSGTKTFQLTQTNASAPDDIVFFTYTGQPHNITIDNVSVREVL